MKMFLAILWLFSSAAGAATCWPEPGKISMTFSGWAVENYRFADVPASWGASRPHVMYFFDCVTKLPKAQLYNNAEAGKVVDAWITGKLMGSNTINTWKVAQGMEPIVLEDTLFVNALLGPKTPYWQVKPQSSTVVGDQPAYTLNADQTRNTKAVGRVAGLTRCDGDKRLGTSTFYFVSGALGTVGLYVQCVKVTPPL